MHNSIRAVFEGATVDPTSGPRSSQSDLSSASRFKTYEVNESLRYQKVFFNIKIDEETLSLTGDKMHLAIMAYDMFGMIMDIRAQSYDFPSLTENLTLFLPKIKAAATRTGINRDIITLSVINEGRNEIAVDVYYKITSECGSLDLMKFVKSHTDLVIPGQNQIRIKYTSIETDYCETGVYGENLYSGGSVLFRVVPRIQNFGTDTKKLIANTYFASLGAKVLERNVLIPIMCFDQKDHIGIQVYNIPANITMIQIVKRDLTKKQNIFKSIRNKDGSAVVIEGTSGNISLSYKDYGVIDEHVYEYKVKIVYGSGESYTSLNSFGIEYLAYDDKIVASINPSPGIITMGTGDVMAFSVGIEKKLTPADVLFNQIVNFKQSPSNTNSAHNPSAENQLFHLFEDELREISSMIEQLVIVRVVRYDMKTANSLYIGDFSAQNHYNYFKV